MNAAASSYDHSCTLIGDIGGTHCRLALYTRNSGVEARSRLPTSAYDEPSAAIRDYLGALSVRPRRAVLAVAGPVIEGRVRMTNTNWQFDAARLGNELGLDDVRLVNDFAAVATGLPRLRPEDYRPIGARRVPADRAPRVVLGPGTGLGVAALVPAGRGWRTLATEGGHTTLAPRNTDDAKILEVLRETWGHVAAETVLSGPGLVNLYRAVAGLRRMYAGLDSPEEITAAARDGDDSLAVEAVQRFFGWLGAVTGNFALAYGALGGVYLTGGVLGDLTEGLANSSFREWFEAKGPYRPYLSGIPTWWIKLSDPAELGLIELAEQI